MARRLIAVRRLWESAPIEAVAHAALKAVDKLVVGLRVLEHLRVEVELKLARAERRELAEHDVLRDALDVVRLRVDGRLHEHVDRLLEGATHERARVDAVDAVARDGQQVASVSHHVAQDGQVAVVDVRAVELDDRSQLAEQSLPYGLDAQVGDDLDDVVGGAARVVDAFVDGHNRGEVDALRVEHPLAHQAELARLGIDHVALRLPHEDAPDAVDAPQRHLCKHALLDLLQELLVPFLLGAVGLSGLVGGVVDHAHPQHQLLGVVVVADDVQLRRAVRLRDLVDDVAHLEVLVRHGLAVELEAQQPRRDAREVDVVVGHLVVGAHEVLVLGDDGGHVVQIDRVVPDLSEPRDRREGRVLEQNLHRLGRLRIALELRLEIHRQRRRLGLLGDVDDLLEARHAKGDVLRGHASVVESVERHLRRGLADRLRSECAHHLSRLNTVLQEAVLDLTKEPIECLRREAVLAEHSLGCERRAKQRKEVVRRVLLRLDGKRIVALDHFELADQLTHLTNDCERRECRRVRRVGLEGALGVGDEPGDVDGQRWVSLAFGEGAQPHVRELFAVHEQLLKLGCDLGLARGVASQLFGGGSRQPHSAVGALAVAPIVQLVESVLERLLQLVDVCADVSDLLVLQRDRVHAVLAIEELQHLALRVAHCTVVLDGDVLHRLDEAALDVPRLGRLHRRVDQPLATAHCVEKELLRGEAPQVRVLDEAARLWPVVVLGEVRQRAVEETVRDALALNVLLADARNHLRDVNEGALGARGDHVLHVVRLLQRSLRARARSIACLVQHLVDLVLERFEHRSPGTALKLVVLRLVNQ
mmetsp:Transcript_15235/g.35011  ORF Transcript_15235/g.35011 Transcript_15235/m.35011 type:complete len:818 (+) Transcript_15235:946-3399(+)